MSSPPSASSRDGSPYSPESPMPNETDSVEYARGCLKLILDERIEERKRNYRVRLKETILNYENVQQFIRYDIEFKRNLFRDEKLRETFTTKPEYKDIFILQKRQEIIRRRKCLVHLPMTQLYNKNLCFFLLKAAMDGLVIIYLATSYPKQTIYQMEIYKKTIHNPKSNSKKEYTCFRSVSGKKNEFSAGGALDERFFDYIIPDFETFIDHEDKVTALSFFMYMLEQTNVRFYANIDKNLIENGDVVLSKYLSDPDRFVIIPVVRDAILRLNKVWQYDTQDKDLSRDGDKPKPLLSFTAYKKMVPEENPVPPIFPDPPEYESPGVISEEDINSKPIDLDEEKSPIIDRSSKRIKLDNKPPKMPDLTQSQINQHFVVQTSHVKR